MAPAPLVRVTDFVESGISLQEQFFGGVFPHAAGAGDDKQNAVALGAIFGGRQNT